MGFIPARIHVDRIENEFCCQADMDKQRPLSRAYRSFYSTSKGEGDIVVHLGSAASAKGKAGVVKGDESRGADGDEASGTMGEIFDGECTRPAGRIGRCRCFVVVNKASVGITVCDVDIKHGSQAYSV